MKVEIISALQDNYIYLFEHANGSCAVVDPGDAAPVFAALGSRALASILLTHRHHDHIGGVGALRERFPDAGIYAPDNCGFADAHICAGGQCLRLPQGEEFAVIATPGHTMEHIAYWSERDDVLFSGDTLFVGGCGRVFEGSPRDMHDSLAALAALPETTKIYCGHEYTSANLNFALAVEPDNRALQDEIATVRQTLASGGFSVPGTIGRERQINPFLRTQVDSVAAAASERVGGALPDSVEVFRVLREWKNDF